MADTFRSLIEQRADEQPDRCFLIDPDSNLSMTFRELRDQCRAFEQFLDSKGIQPGSHVGFLLDNGYWTVIVFFGTMYAGRVVIPLNAVASVGNLAYILENSDAEAVFVSSNYRELMTRIIENQTHTVTCIDLDVQKGPDKWMRFQESTDSAGCQVTEETEGMILYTSGTVGRPKGAVHTHQSLLAGGRNVEFAHQITSDDCVYCVLPLYHINGQIVTTIAQLVTGSCVVMPRKFSVNKFWDHVEKFKCTWFSIVPTIAKYLLDQAHREPEQTSRIHKLKYLRFGRSATSAMPAAMHKEFEETFGVPMIETMGLTETAAPILSNPMPPAKRISGSVGIPFGDEVIVVDKQLKEVSRRQVGEFAVRGPNVIREYFKLPDTTESSFTPDGWFLTGDLGFQDEDGYFFVSGRSKELIIKGGENISPREIDDVLYQHEAVLEAAAFGLPDDAYGQVVAAAIVVRGGFNISADELSAFCIEHLGPYRTPSNFYFVEEMPKGPSGKIQRLELEKMISQLN